MTAVANLVPHPPRPELAGKTIVEVIDVNGIVRERHRFDATTSPIRIGRSITCDVIVDDPHVAPIHAILEITPSGTVRVSDGGSINGIVVDGKRHRSASGLAIPDERLEIGRSTVRVRTFEGELAPEQPIERDRRSAVFTPIALAGVLGLGVAAVAFYQRWLGAPADLLTDAATGVLYPFSLLGGWIASWSLLTRIIRHEWRFAEHAAIAFGVALLYDLTTEAANLGFFMAGARVPAWEGVVAAVVALGLLLALHLRQASLLTSGKVLAAALIVPMLFGGGYAWISNRLDRQGLMRAEGVLRLYPPQLRMTPAEPVGDFFKRATDLRAKADRRRGDSAADAED